MAKDPVRGRELKKHVPESCAFEVDYAEFLDEALVDAWELQESWARNGEHETKAKEWWVVKPGMSDKGAGVKLFRSEEGLRRIFEGWEEDEDSDYEDEDSDAETTETSEDPIIMTANDTHNDANTALETPNPSSDGIITSQLRHFLAQRYIAHPLLFPSLQNRKFHLRSYVLAVGALRVYVFREMLALFASVPYRAPGHDNAGEHREGEGEGDDLDMRAHLTNTCLQDPSSEDADSVVPFWDLPPTTSSSGQDWRTPTLAQITTLTSHLFLAAATTQALNFQTLPNAFEVFGVDWLVDERGKVWLLEVNAFPDFRMSGERGKGVMGRLWEGVLGVLVGEGSLLQGTLRRARDEMENNKGEENEAAGRGGPKNGGVEEGEESAGMIKVLDIHLGRR